MSEKDDKLNKGSFLYIGDQNKAEWGYPEGYPYKEIGIILDGTFEFIDDNGLYMHKITDKNFTYADGKSYTVIWDGEAYQCVATTFDGLSVLGNLGIMGLPNDTGEPFLFLMDDTGKSVFANDTAVTHTITVRWENVYPISYEFLPQAAQTTYGAIKKAAHVPHVTEAPTSNDFNKLLSALREAGIMSQSE